MRISGGIYCSRILKTPKGDLTRPTSGIVRETLFNIIAPQLDQARFLDLFAGSGSVGIEALSRGASFAILVEKHRVALDCLRTNVDLLHIQQECLILPSPVERALAQLATQGEQFDFIFLDPPFADTQAYMTVLTQLGASNLLTPEGSIIAQHAAVLTLPGVIGPYICYRNRLIGDNTLTFYRYTFP